MLKLTTFSLLVSIWCLINTAHGKLDMLGYSRYVEELSQNETIVQDFENNINELLKQDPNYFDYMPKDFTFDCEIVSDNLTSRTVHQLRPQDVRIVAAMGDSLTAALGSNAKTVIGLLAEYRGRSWSMGGDKSLEELVTFPNILRKFNEKLYGASTKWDLSLLTPEGVGLNAAVSGQEANHVPDQARVLLQRLKEDPNVDWNNDWKVVTLFIGGNDLCDFCKDPILHSPKQYIYDIQQALDTLYQELPRTFVNLVTVLNVDDVKLLNKGIICKLLHIYACDCAAFPKDKQQEQMLLEYIKEYQTLTEELAKSGRYDGRDDFTVVVQPFMRDFRVPRLPDGSIDFGFFAPDCFHFSTKGQGNR